MRWSISLLKKSEAPSAIKAWCKKMWTQYKKNPKIWFSDNGGEFVNNELQAWAHQEGLRWDLTTAYTPEQNGIAESTNKVILNKARAMIIGSGCLEALWCFAMDYACYVTNRLANKTTKKILFQDFEEDLEAGAIEVDLTNIRVFGCRAYRNTPKENRQLSRKFALRGEF